MCPSLAELLEMLEGPGPLPEHVEKCPRCASWREFIHVAAELLRIPAETPNGPREY